MQASAQGFTRLQYSTGHIGGRVATAVWPRLRRRGEQPFVEGSARRDVREDRPIREPLDGSVVVRERIRCWRRDVRLVDDELAEDLHVVGQGREAFAE